MRAQMETPAACFCVPGDPASTVVLDVRVVFQRRESTAGRHRKGKPLEIRLRRLAAPDDAVEFDIDITGGRSRLEGFDQLNEGRLIFAADA